MPHAPLTLSPLDPAARTPGLLATAQLQDNQRAFAAALGKADRSGAGKPQTKQEAATDAAEQYITATLILPLLKQLRATNNAAPPFAPTQAERQFGALQDAELAQRIAHATHFPLVERVARDLLKKANEPPPPPGTTRSDPLHPPELHAAAIPDSRMFPATPRLVPGAPAIAPSH